MSEQLKELPAVARNIHLPCKKCGVDRYHVVVAHLTSNSAKVQCEVCKSTKTFKLTAAKAARASKPGVKSATRSSSRKPDFAGEWANLKEKIGTDQIQNYNMKAKFAANSAIQHPKFGIGFVLSSSPEKIEVSFQDSKLSLVHNRG